MTPAAVLGIVLAAAGYIALGVVAARRFVRAEERRYSPEVNRAMRADPMAQGFIGIYVLLWPVFLVVQFVAHPVFRAIGKRVAPSSPPPTGRRDEHLD